MKNKLKKLSILFVLLLSVFAISCKLDANKPVDAETEIENNEQHKKLITFTPSVQMQTARSALPEIDVSEINVEEMTNVTFYAYRGDSTNSTINRTYNTIADFLEDSFTLNEDTYRFDLTAYYSPDPEKSADKLRFISHISAFDLTETNTTVNFVLRLDAITNYDNSYNYGTVEIRIDFPVGEEVSLISTTLRNSSYSQSISASDWKFMKTEEGAPLFIFKKLLYNQYSWYTIDFLFKNHSNGVYKYSTSVYIQNGITSSESHSVTKFYTGNPVNLCLPDGTTEIDYYAPTYGYSLPKADLFTWYEDEEHETEAKTSFGAGEIYGEKTFYAVLKDGIYAIAMKDADENLVKTLYYKSNFNLANNVVTSSDKKNTFEISKDGYFIEGLYTAKDFNSSSKLTSTYNYNSSNNITTIYINYIAYKYVTICDLNDVVLETLSVKSGYTLNLFDVSSENEKYIFNGGYSAKGYYEDKECTKPLAMNNLINLRADKTIYVQLQKIFTKKLNDLIPSRIYTLPVEGENCRIISADGVISGDKVWFYAKSKVSNWTPEFICEYIDEEQPASYDIEPTLITPEATPIQLGSGYGLGVLDRYTVVDTSATKEPVVAYTCELTADKKYYMEFVYSGYYSSNLSDCTNYGVIIVNDTTNKEVYRIRSNNTASFIVPETGSYTIYVVDYNDFSKDYIKMALRIVERKTASLQLISVTGLQDVAVTASEMNAEGEVTFTASAGYDTYEWSMPTLNGTSVVLGNSQTLTLDMDDYSDILGESMLLVIKATYPNGTWYRTTYLVDIIENSTEGAADEE